MCRPYIINYTQLRVTDLWGIIPVSAHGNRIFRHCSSDGLDVCRARPTIYPVCRLQQPRGVAVIKLINRRFGGVNRLYRNNSQ